MKKWFTLLLLCILSIGAFAQDVVVPTQDFIMFLLDSIGGLKGASTLAVVYVAVQALIMFLKTELFGKLFKNVKGSVKLIIVLALTLVAGVVSLMQANGLTLAAALLHSSTLAAFSVLANQIYKQFFVKED